MARKRRQPPRGRPIGRPIGPPPTPVHPIAIGGPGPSGPPGPPLNIQTVPNGGSGAVSMPIPQTGPRPGAPTAGPGAPGRPFSPQFGQPGRAGQMLERMRRPQGWRPAGGRGQNPWNDPGGGGARGGGWPPRQPAQDRPQQPRPAEPRQAWRPANAPAPQVNYETGMRGPAQVNPINVQPSGPPPGVDPNDFNALVQLGISQGMPPAMAAQKAAALFGPDGQRIMGQMTLTQAEAEAAGLTLAGGGLFTGAMGQPTSAVNGPGGLIDQANQALAAGKITPQQHTELMNGFIAQAGGNTYNLQGPGGSIIGGNLPGQASTPGVNYTTPGPQVQPPANPMGIQTVPTPGPVAPGGLPPGAQYLGAQAPQAPFPAPGGPQPGVGGGQAPSNMGSVQGQQSPLSQTSQQLPLSPAFEAQRRVINDQLSATLAQIGVAREEIPAMVNLITSRMATQQAQDTEMLNESMNARGLYDSGIRAQDTQLLNAGYDRQRQDMAFDTTRQLRDLAAQESSARMNAEQQLAELLLELAQETLGDPSAPIEGVSPFDIDLGGDPFGSDLGFDVPGIDLPTVAPSGGRKRKPAKRKKGKK